MGRSRRAEKKIHIIDQRMNANECHMFALKTKRSRHIQMGMCVCVKEEKRRKLLLET